MYSLTETPPIIYTIQSRDNGVAHVTIARACIALQCSLSTTHRNDRPP